MCAVSTTLSYFGFASGPFWKLHCCWLDKLIILAFSAYFQGDMYLRGTNFALFRGDVFKGNKLVNYFPAFKQVKWLAVIMNVLV